MKYHRLIGVDLAKNVFQICTVDAHNKVISNQKLNRVDLSDYIAKQKPATIAMEACYSSHYWARLFESFGHQVMLLPAQHVKPFVRGNKNDHNDALAIVEAAQRPNIKCVPIKTVAQQDIQCLHRLRERAVSARTQLTNQARGLLSEYGIVFPRGFKAFRTTLASLIDPADPRISVRLKPQLQHMLDEYFVLTERINNLNKTLSKIAQENPLCRYLMSIPGIGYVNATALFSAIGNGCQFNNAREFSVWLGITPRQHASGQKQTMLGISKRGNRYLRKQLIHGARAAMAHCKKRDDHLSHWVNALIARRGHNKANVALANKMARLCWVLLQREQMYCAEK